MAKLPDDTVFGAIEAGPSGRPIASFDTTGYSRGAAAMAQGVKDIGTGLEKAGKEVYAVALQKDKEREKEKALAAFNEAKANAEYLTRTQELRAGLEQENDPSKLAAYEPYFRSATEIHKTFFANPEYASKWAQNQEQEAKRAITSRFDALTREQMIETTNATLRQLQEAAQQSPGDERTRFIDSATGIIHGLKATNQISEAAAQEMQRGWVEKYATDWFLAQPAESRLEMLRTKSAAAETSLGTDGLTDGPSVAAPGNTPSAAPDTNTPLEFIPKEKWPDLLLAAQQEADRGAVVRSVERTDAYRQNIGAARDGKIMLLDRGAIERDPDITPASKEMLLQEHAAAKETGELYTWGSQNDARATWNAGDARDRKALEVVDQWGGVVAGVRAADPKSAGVAAHRFGETGMVSDGVKGSIKGLVRGGNDRQLDYAMTLLGDMSRRNPNAFLHAFDKDTVRTLTAWQNRGEQTPAAFREMLKRINDPAQAKAREAREAEGRKLAHSVSDHALLSVHADPNWPDPTKPAGGTEAPAMAMHREAWNALFAEGFAASDGNQDTAKQYADRMILANWAVSPSGGGRLMKDAPETLPNWILPAVDGSRDWMKHQVEAAVRSFTSGADVWDRVPAHGLIALPTTGAEIATLNAGGTLPDGQQSPTWGLVYVDPATGAPAMVPFAFDVESAGKSGPRDPEAALRKFVAALDSDAAVRGEFGDVEPADRESSKSQKSPTLLDALGETWPVRTTNSIYGAVTLPGDVYAGRFQTQPSVSGQWSDQDESLAQMNDVEMRRRALELAGLVTGGSFLRPQVASVGSGGTRKLAMDDEARLKRAVDLGYSSQPFYRGEAGMPMAYPEGAHFSRSKEVADGYARWRGAAEAREFRLDLSRTFFDGVDLTAKQYGKIVKAATKTNPDFAKELADSIAPGKGVEWVLGFAKAKPDFVVVKGSHAAALRFAIQNSAKDNETFLKAGYDALDDGRDIRKLTGRGIRLSHAAFDPARWKDLDILATLAPLALTPLLSSPPDLQPKPPPKQE